MERMNNFERLTRCESEAAVQAVLLEGLVDRIGALEEILIASKLVKVDDHGQLRQRTQ
jgi:hypothetical protein